MSRRAAALFLLIFARVGALAAAFSLEEAFAAAARDNGTVVLPPGAHAGSVTLAAPTSVRVVARGGATWTARGATALTVLAGARVELDGVRFDDCALAVSARAGARVRASGCAFVGCGVEAAAPVDARRNFWGARDGPAVAAPATTGGRRAPAAAAAIVLAAPRAAAAWAPFAANAFHSAHAAAWLHWPADGDAASWQRGAVVGAVFLEENATLEYTVVPDAGCALATGRRPAPPPRAPHAARLLRVPLGGDCGGARARRRLTAAVAGETVAAAVFTSAALGERRVALAPALAALPFELAARLPDGTLAAGETVEVDRIAYELRGGASAPGCADRVADQIAAPQAAASRFVAIRAQEDGDDLFLRARVAPPAVRSALIVALRRQLQAASTRAGCAAPAALWATPELVAEDARLDALLAAATLAPARREGFAPAGALTVGAAFAAAFVWGVIAARVLRPSATAAAAAAPPVQEAKTPVVGVPVAAQPAPIAPPQQQPMPQVLPAVGPACGARGSGAGVGVAGAAIALSVAHVAHLGLPPLPPPKHGRASPPAGAQPPAPQPARQPFVRQRRKEYLAV